MCDFYPFHAADRLESWISVLSREDEVAAYLRMTPDLRLRTRPRVAARARVPGTVGDVAGRRAGFDGRFLCLLYLRGYRRRWSAAAAALLLVLLLLLLLLLFAAAAAAAAAAVAVAVAFAA